MITFQYLEEKNKQIGKADVEPHHTAIRTTNELSCVAMDQT